MSAIPPGWGEREARPRAQRWPVALAAQVEKVAAQASQPFQVAMFYLVRFALDELERREMESKKRK